MMYTTYLLNSLLWASLHGYKQLGNSREGYTYFKNYNNGEYLEIDTDPDRWADLCARYEIYHFKVWSWENFEDLDSICTDQIGN